MSERRGDADVPTPFRTYTGPRDARSVKIEKASHPSCTLSGNVTEHHHHQTTAAGPSLAEAILCAAAITHVDSEIFIMYVEL